MFCEEAGYVCAGYDKNMSAHVRKKHASCILFSSFLQNSSILKSSIMEDFFCA